MVVEYPVCPQLDQWINSGKIIMEVELKVIANPEVQARFTTINLEAAPMGAKKFGAFVKTDNVKWAKLIKNAGIEPQ
jgi:tripartite-type tricarboxylate transporter receptor subunit TctC